MRRGAPGATEGRQLPEAFFRDVLPGRWRRTWVLPLGPVMLLWVVTALLQQGGLEWRSPDSDAPLFGSVVPDAQPRRIAFGGGRSERRLRLASALIARGEPARAREILSDLRRAFGDVAVVLRPLARAEKLLGHREKAADLYVILLQDRADDLDALEFFLRYRYEENDLEGALDVADELQAYGALTGDSAHFADLLRAEHAARTMAARLRH